jgi:hypothetical protein
MTKILAIAFLIMGFLVGDAYGEGGKIHYCTETASHGFRYDEHTNRYIPSKFAVSRFKMKFGPDKNTTLIDSNGRKRKMDCEFMVVDGTEWLGYAHCTGRSLDTFIWNPKTGWFNLFFGSPALGSSTIVSSYGTCDKF